MTIRKDSRTGRHFFRTWVRLPDGRRLRVFGTPGVPGPYHDLPNNAGGAKAAEQRAIAKALTGQDVKPAIAPAAIQTVREYVVPFMAGYAAAHKSGSNTDKDHRLEAYILPIVGDVRLDQLRQEHVDRIVAAMLAKGLARKTINNTTSVLSSLIGYAVKNKVITDPELTYQIKAQGAELVALPAEHVEKLVAAAPDARYRFAILAASDAGLRIGEIRALERPYVNELAREITVAWSYDRAGAHGETKGWERRAVPMNDRLWAAYRALDEGSALLFGRLDGKPISYDTVAKEMRAIYDRAGITRGAEQLWHTLRHTFGTQLANSGVPVQRIRALMGHKSIETTLRYMHSTREELREAVKNLGSQRAAERQDDRKPAK